MNQRCCRGASAKGGGLNHRRAFYWSSKTTKGAFSRRPRRLKNWKITNIIISSEPYPVSQGPGLVKPVYIGKGSDTSLDNHSPLCLKNALAKILDSVWGQVYSNFFPVLAQSGESLRLAQILDFNQRLWHLRKFANL